GVFGWCCRGRQQCRECLVGAAKGGSNVGSVCLMLPRTRQRRYKVVSKTVDVQEVKATALAGHDRYIEGYEVEGHQKCNTPKFWRQAADCFSASGWKNVHHVARIWSGSGSHRHPVSCSALASQARKKIIDSVEGIIGSLSLLLVRTMCTTLSGSGSHRHPVSCSTLAS
nr:hypothetical protein [Tanacetum cinerariifolium]